MNAPPTPQALYLSVGSELVFAVYHAAADAAAEDTAVLICPPFGWEEVCSYRPRRDWAEDLAGRGHPTLRLDLPGTGDSSGTPDDPRRLDAWSDCVCATAAWLSEQTSARRICAIGIGLGGLVVCRAAAAGAPIDEAVLWGTPSRGRTFVRELRAFARLESAQVTVTEAAETEQAGSPSQAQAGLEAGGFALSEETLEELAALDLAELSFPADLVRRALLLGRNGIEAEQRLRTHLEDSGIDVELAAGADYGLMMAEPQQAKPPGETFAQVAAWLLAARGHAGQPADAPPGTPRAQCKHPASARQSDEIEMTVQDAAIRETTVQVEQPFGALFGILARPLENAPAPLAVVLLNAGAIRRIGPNRMWVGLARRWAAQGVPTLRLDVEGIGDADGDASRFSDVAELYVPELVDQVRGALDMLQDVRVSSRFVLLGLCSGAYWSFHAALQDQRVSAALMLNPQVLFWDASQETVRDLRKAFLQRSAWLRLLRGESSAARAGTLLREIPAGLAVLARRRLAGRPVAAPSDEALQEALDRLLRADKRALFVFSGREPLYEELAAAGGIERLDAWPHVELVRIPGHDHTLRPLAARHSACDALEHALQAELERASQTGVGLTPSADPQQ